PGRPPGRRGHRPPRPPPRPRSARDPRRRDPPRAQAPWRGAPRERSADECPPCPFHLRPERFRRAVVLDHEVGLAAPPGVVPLRRDPLLDLRGGEAARRDDPCDRVLAPRRHHPQPLDERPPPGLEENRRLD